jgi:hypothetical protein
MVTEAGAGGGAALLTVTVMGVEVATFVKASIADAVRACEPSGLRAVFHEIVYGDEVTAEPSGEPSR